MKLTAAGITIDPVIFTDYGYSGTDRSGNHMDVALEGTGHVTLAIPALVKERAGGNLMSYTFSIRRTLNDHLCIVGKITEDGKKDRVFESSVDNKMSITPYMQRAVQEVISKYNKKKDKDGWRINGEDAPSIKEPMLLHRWDKVPPKKLKGPWLVSPKLDGIRGTYDVKSGKVYSRKRGAFNLPTIEEQLSFLGIAADGELWAPGYNWETISGTVSRDQDTTHDSKGQPIVLHKVDLQFHIFDRTDLTGVPYINRLASLIDLRIDERFPNLRVVPSTYCETQGEVDVAYKNMLSLGAEGAVARTLDGTYLWNTRSYEVLKLKPLFSKEFKLHKVVFDEDPTYGKLVSYQMVADNNELFKATPSKSKAERAEDYKKIGGMFSALEPVWITCEYRDTYASGVPKFAVMKGIRVVGT